MYAACVIKYSCVLASPSAVPRPGPPTPPRISELKLGQYSAGRREKTPLEVFPISISVSFFFCVVCLAGRAGSRSAVASPAPFFNVTARWGVARGLLHYRPRSRGGIEIDDVTLFPYPLLFLVLFLACAAAVCHFSRWSRRKEEEE